jgi:hypothetical protein
MLSPTTVRLPAAAAVAMVAVAMVVVAMVVAATAMLLPTGWPSPLLPPRHLHPHLLLLLPRPLLRQRQQLQQRPLRPLPLIRRCPLAAPAAAVQPRPDLRDPRAGVRLSASAAAPPLRGGCCWLLKKWALKRWALELRLRRQ